MGRNEIYYVTGKYMTGSEVTAYHLTSDSGQSLIVNKEKAILMISRGLIENMRVQYSDDEVIIRGKGINLKTIPVFDMNKNEFRQSNAPKQGTTNKTTRQNPMSQYRIVKRMMFKTSCIGYIVVDAANRESRMKKDKAIELALKGYIINADAQKYIPAGETEPKIVLRGVGCEIKKLPAVLVDQSGRLIDDTANNEIITRATLMRRGGILYNNYAKNKKTFAPGDYIVCTPNGGLDVLPAAKAKDVLNRSEATSTVCDSYLNNVAYYNVEFYGDAKRDIAPAMVIKWPVVKITKK